MPPKAAVLWVVWDMKHPERTTVVRTQMWFDASVEGARLLGVVAGASGVEAVRADQRRAK